MIITGLDLETTGLDVTAGHRIIEVCAQIYRLEDRALLKTWTQRINPERPIDPGAQAVHGIGFEDLVSCPRWPEIAPMLSKVLTLSDAIVAHNGAGFDMPFVRHELTRVGVGCPDRPVIDTMLEGTWAHYLGKRPNLGELCEACGVDYDRAKAHSAEYDVQVMMDCFWLGLDSGGFALPKQS